MKASIGGGSDFPVLESDSYLARIYMVFDIGIQEGKFGDKHQVIIGWELPTELGEDGRPYVISKFYTLSLNPKSNLCKDIEAMSQTIPEDKKGSFDFQKLIGMKSQLTVEKYQNAEGYDRNRITTVSKPMKGAKVPAAINAPVFFDLESPDWDLFEQQPEWLKDKCNRNSITPAAPDSPAPAIEVDDDDDDIPWED